MKHVQSENLGGGARSTLVGIMGSLVEIGLTDLPKTRGHLPSLPSDFVIVKF